MKRVIEVLLVDDDEDDYVLTTECLREIPTQSFSVTWASGYREALGFLENRPYDICLFDFILGGKTGLDLLREVNRRGLDTPIILLTGKGDFSIDQEAMELGATDYLVKCDLDAETLERSIRYALNQADVLRALRQSEEKHRSIFESSIDVIYLADEEGRFVDVNHSATRLLGYSLKEFRAMKVTDLFVRDRAGQHFIDTLKSRKELRDFETELTAKNGDKKYCLMSCAPQNSESHEKVVFQGFIQDITRRRKAEQELLLAERLAATGRFVRMLGHEIRNPLMNIDLSLEQINSENQNPELNDYIDIIRRNSDRIGRLLNDLLQSSNPGQLHVGDCDLEKVLENALQRASDRIALKGIRVEKDIDSCVGVLKADAGKLTIAFLNIILNAVEVMEEKKGVLHIQVRQVADECAVSFKDNGIGIAPENLNRIFEPYFSRKTNGLGLGLAAVHTIVQSHQGRIEVESTLGQGAQFTVFLPKG